MYLTVKQYVRVHFPRFFVRARDLKDQIKIEYKTIRQVGISRILKQLLNAKDKWRTELPVQCVCELNLGFDSLADLVKATPSFSSGGHTYYFSPTNDLPETLQSILRKYPESSGIKILKRQGGVDEPYPAKNVTCKTHAALAPKNAELLLVHNLFFNLGLGIRVYDLVNLRFKNGDIHAAYIVEHVEGDKPSVEAAEKFIELLKDLEAKKIIKLVNWNGYQDMDFVVPDCNGNLIVDAKSGTLKYLDLQNFALEDYYGHLERVALDASNTSHFGQKCYLIGGKYLYQEIPGLNIVAKRSPQIRFQAIQELLAKSDVSLRDKLVIDVGCNLGLMGAQYLKQGAYWLHGFDLPSVVAHSSKVLLSVGCTRFSLSGLSMDTEVSLTAELPKFLDSSLNGCVISYLAIRGHVGWIKDLANIPWGFMIYEGHEEETAERSREFLMELNKLKKCYIASEGYITDANSLNRYIAIVKASNE